jgi:hypothetical protein
MWVEHVLPSEPPPLPYAEQLPAFWDEQVPFAVEEQLAFGLPCAEQPAAVSPAGWPPPLLQKPVPWPPPVVPDEQAEFAPLAEHVMVVPPPVAEQLAAALQPRFAPLLELTTFPCGRGYARPNCWVAMETSIESGPPATGSAAVPARNLARAAVLGKEIEGAAVRMELSPR